MDSYFDMKESDHKIECTEIKGDDSSTLFRAHFPNGPVALYFAPMITLSAGGYHSWSFKLSNNVSVLFGAVSVGESVDHFFNSSDLAVRSTSLYHGNQNLKKVKITSKTITIEVNCSQREIVFSLEGEEVERKSFSQDQEHIRVGVVGHNNTKLEMEIEEQFAVKPAKR